MSPFTKSVGSLFLLAAAACGGGSGSADAALPQYDGALPTGTFSLTWTIEDADGGGTVDCAAVGAASVVLSFRPTDASPGFNELFDCAGGTGQTGARPATSYTIDFALKDASGRVLATSERVFNQVIAAGTDTPLEAVTFSTTTTGQLAFKVKVPGAPGLNCADEGTSGAGVTGVRLELRNANGDCVPTAFDVAGRAIEPACPTEVGDCIEDNEAITATGVPAGTGYTLVMQGFEADATDVPCYKGGVGNVDVSGGDLVTSLGVVNMPIDATNDACVAP